MEDIEDEENCPPRQQTKQTSRPPSDELPAERFHELHILANLVLIAGQVINGTFEDLQRVLKARSPGRFDGHVELDRVSKRISEIHTRGKALHRPGGSGSVM